MTPCARLLRTLLLLFAGLAVPAASAATRVLYLGDSLSFGTFGKSLDQQLRQSGCDVYTMVTGGATPYYWLSDFAPVSADAGHWIKHDSYERRLRRARAVPKIEPILRDFRPETVIVQTGTNLYATLRDRKRPPAERVRAVEYLIDRMCRVLLSAHCRIYWITPPDSHPDKYPRELQQQMRAIISRTAGHYGRVFDSYAVTRYTEPYPKEDGIHYGPAQATAWARLVGSDLVPFLEHRIAGPAREIDATTSAHSPEENPSAFPSSSADPAEGETPLPEVIIRKALPVLSEANTLEVQVVLKETSPLPDLRRCPYRNALACYEYEVTRVIRGSYPHATLRVAHQVLRNSQVRPEAGWVPGRRETLTLVPLASYPDTEKYDTIDELPDTTLPLLTPRQN